MNPHFREMLLFSITSIIFFILIIEFLNKSLFICTLFALIVGYSLLMVFLSLMVLIQFKQPNKKTHQSTQTDKKESDKQPSIMEVFIFFIGII